MAKTREHALDLRGQKFGRWTVLRKDKTKGLRGEIYWLCRCQCGVRKPVLANTLRNGRSISCGCYSRDRTRVHGMEGTAIYNTWAQMVGRCHNPNATSYPHYGARGIRVCERWRDFKNFYADMGDKPDGKTLDRLDGGGNYEPGNVRWATPKEQNRNKPRAVMVEWGGKTVTLAELAEQHGISRKKVRARMLLGASLEDALKNVRYGRWNRVKK